MERILRLKEVTEIIGLSGTTIWRMENKGNFPARRQIGPHSVGWLLRDVEEWIENLPVAEGGKV